MKWVLFAMMRRKSERIPDKMLHKLWTPIGFVSLLEWNIHRLASWSQSLGVPYYLGVAQEDRHKVPADAGVIERDQESLQGEDYMAIYRNIPPLFDVFDWALWVNACCPFVSKETITRFMENVENGYSPTDELSIWPGFEESSFIFYKDKMVFPPPNEAFRMNTKLDPTFLIQCHAFVAHPARCLGRSSPGPGGCISVGRRTREFLDLDYPDDLHLVAAYAAYKWRRQSAPTTVAAAELAWSDYG
jgi:hypothetical protein